MQNRYVPTRELRELNAEALQRARSGDSLLNVSAVFREFIARGIPESEIKPRVNVLTFRAWRALGRTVRRGEKGVRLVTFREVQRRSRVSGQLETVRIPSAAFVFHVSQTDAVEYGYVPDEDAASEGLS